MALLNRRTDGWYDSPGKELWAPVLLLLPVLIAVVVGLLLPRIARLLGR